MSAHFSFCQRLSVRACEFVHSSPSAALVLGLGGGGGSGGGSRVIPPRLRPVALEASCRVARNGVGWRAAESARTAPRGVVSGRSAFMWRAESPLARGESARPRSRDERVWLSVGGLKQADGDGVFRQTSHCRAWASRARPRLPKARRVSRESWQAAAIEAAPCPAPRRRPASRRRRPAPRRRRRASLTAHGRRVRRAAPRRRSRRRCCARTWCGPRATPSAAGGT
eukprot:scaffold65261_cov69-Phaeocystis_antarctica.AAC.2